MTEDNSFHEEGELSLKNDKLQNNGHGFEAKSDKTVDRHRYSDDTGKFRSISPSAKRRSNNRSRSPGTSLKRIVRNEGRSPPRKSGDQSPAHRIPEPSASNRGRSLSQSTSPVGAPECIRKGRGFTERYSFASRYHLLDLTDTVEETFMKGAKTGYVISLSNLPQRQRRRSRSRSISWSPDSYRGRYRDRRPIGNPSPRDTRPPISEGLKSRLGPKIGEEHSPIKRRFRSRSRSFRSSFSRSPEASPLKDRDRISSASPSRFRSKSSSPSGQRGLVSYGD